ncbi:MAG: hypothetical protein R2699_09455 [Acidimicrobiales bacterium]
MSFGDLNDDGTTDLISPSYYGELSVSYNETFNRFPVMPNQSMYAYARCRRLWRARSHR